MAGKWQKTQVLRLENDFTFVVSWVPPDEEKPLRELTYGYVESEWSNFGEFRSHCNSEVRIMADAWTLEDENVSDDVTDDFDEA